MKTKIKAAGKQVKDMEQLTPGQVAWAERTRAKEFRKMAQRLRDEAMLMDVAAKGSEDRALKLAGMRGKWRSLVVVEGGQERSVTLQ